MEYKTWKDMTAEEKGRKLIRLANEIRYFVKDTVEDTELFKDIVEIEHSGTAQEMIENAVAAYFDIGFDEEDR